MHRRAAGPKVSAGAPPVPRLRAGGSGGAGPPSFRPEPSPFAHGTGRGGGHSGALFYEDCLGVSFWDYRELPWNLHGRVCLLFSAAWALLLPAAVYWIHPWARRLAAAIPLPVTWAAIAAVGADVLVSTVLLRCTGSQDSLRWYRRRTPPFPAPPRRFLFP